MRTTLTFRSGTVLQHRVKLLFISTFLSLLQITHTGDSDRFRQSCNAPGCRRRLQQHLLICVHILQWRPWGTFKATGNDNQEQSRSPIVADGVNIRKVSILISNATYAPGIRVYRGPPDFLFKLAFVRKPNWKADPDELKEARNRMHTTRANTILCLAKSAVRHEECSIDNSPQARLEPPKIWTFDIWVSRTREVYLNISDICCNMYDPFLSRFDVMYVKITNKSQLRCHFIRERGNIADSAIDACFTRVVSLIWSMYI